MSHNLAFDDDGGPVQSVGFDYDEIDRVPEPASNRGEQLSNMLVWFGSLKAAQYFGRNFTLRLLALSWVCNPAYHEGKSLSQLAREHGVSVQLLSRYCADASRIFAIRNRSQKTHGTRWRNRRTSTPVLKVGA